MRTPVRRIAFAVAALVALAWAAIAYAATGDLSQNTDAPACVSETGNGDLCEHGRALNGPVHVGVSPDGQSAYAAIFNSNGVAVFDRDPTTGELDQKPGTAGCITETGTGGACQDGTALNGASSVVVSGDGESVYVSSFVSDAVAVFDRDTTAGATRGALTQKTGTAGCVSDTGTGGACQDDVALNDVAEVALSADGESVYAGSTVSDAVAIFDRDTTAGATQGELTQKTGTAGCVSEDTTGGACQDGVALNGAGDLVVSADGESVYVASLFSNAVAVFDRDTTAGATQGELTQKTGTAGCVSEDGTGVDCQNGVALNGAREVVISADGLSVYVASFNSAAVAVFDRDTTAGATQGALTQKTSPAGCVSETGTGGDCQDAIALLGLSGIAVSPDGESLYAAGFNGSAIAIFDRSPAGALAQKTGTDGCVSDTGSGGECGDVAALGGPNAVTVSPDGNSVYVPANFADAVTNLIRDGDGDLTQPTSPPEGCVSETGSNGVCEDAKALQGANDVTVSPDGASAYVIGGSFSSGSVAIFDRDPTTGDLEQKAGLAGCVSEFGSGGDCEDGKGLAFATGVTVSPDGGSVYVVSAGSDGGVAIFDRNTSTGALTQKAGTAGCVSETGSGGTCQVGTALAGGRDIAVTGDGKTVIVASANSNAIAIFDRDLSTGALTQKAGTAGCVSEDGTGGCQDGFALEGVDRVAVSPDGESAYFVSLFSGASGAVAIFDRNTTTGALTQKPGIAGCLSEDGSSGTCQDGVALDAVSDLTVSADGDSLYVTSVISAAVAIFDRSSSGALTQKAGTAGCISETGGACQDGFAFANPSRVVASPDRRSVYVTMNNFDGAVAIIDREPSTGALTQKPGPAGCLSDSGSGGACRAGKRLEFPTALAMSLDDKNMYVTFPDSDGGVSIIDRDLGAAPAGRTLSVTVTGAGTVAGLGIDCPGDCSETYFDGTEVSLGAGPGAGASFGGWGGACSGTGPCTVTADANKSVSATFTGSGPGTTPPPGGTGDTTPPQTTITKAPKKKKTKKSKAKVKFTFTSSEAGSRFECQLDKKPFTPCTSPTKLKAKVGKHAFQVKATDAAGNADSSPATAQFKVVRK